MRGTPTMSTWDNLRLTLAEAATAPSEIERQWRIAAAWTYAQILDGIPCNEWTPPPAWFGPGYEMDDA